jgi:tetratricopeptide (TPR) repeat protein
MPARNPWWLRITPRTAAEDSLNTWCTGYSFQKQDDAQAAANYRWALDLQPGLFAANINLGNLLDTHGELEEAAEYYRRAAKAEPRAQLAVNNLGNTMNRMARHSEAVAALSTAVRLDPSNWQASLNLGARRPRPRPSALRLYARKAEAWHHRRLGNSLCAKGDLQSAVQLYQSVVRANPKCAASPRVGARAMARGARRMLTAAGTQQR